MSDLNKSNSASGQTTDTNGSTPSAKSKITTEPRYSANIPAPVVPSKVNREAANSNPKVGMQNGQQSEIGNKTANKKGFPFLNRNQGNVSSTEVVNLNLKPLRSFLIAYIIFSIPSFLASILWVFVVLAFLGLLVTASSAVNSSANSNQIAQHEQLSYQVLKKGNNKKNILVYDLEGIILSGKDENLKGQNVYVDYVKQDFEKIKADESIKNVVFRLNTPGGSVFAAETLGDAIADLVKAKKQEQAVFYFDELVASGGLWVAYKNVNNYVVASQYGQTGSIGVMGKLPNLQGLAEKIGYKEIVIKSGESKDIMNPLREPTREELEFLQSEVERAYDLFVEIVSTGRKLPEKTVRAIANGFVYNNSQAQKYGLIDELNNLERAIAKAADNANLGNDYSVLKISKPSNFLESLLQIRNDLLGLPVETLRRVERSSLLKPGVIYALDEYRL